VKTTAPPKTTYARAPGGVVAGSVTIQKVYRMNATPVIGSNADSRRAPKSQCSSRACATKHESQAAISGGRLVKPVEKRSGADDHAGQNPNAHRLFG
jgi:hypothetical protein